MKDLKSLSDNELVDALTRAVEELNRLNARTLAAVRAGKYVHPSALDCLRGDLDDDVVDELEELNAKRID